MGLLTSRPHPSKRSDGTHSGNIDIPEPLLSKATAFAITATLLTVFSLSEIYHVASAWFRLRERAADARSLADLDAGAREFGRATGGTSLRVLVALATLFIGRAMPAPRPAPPPPPTASAVVTLSPAGTAAVARTVVAGNIRIGVLTDGTIVLPVAGAVTASSMPGGGARNAATTSGGSTADSTSGGATTGSRASGTTKTKPKTPSQPTSQGVAVGSGNRASTTRPDRKTSASTAGTTSAARGAFELNRQTRGALLRAGTQPFRSGSLTNAGRALTKHPELLGHTKETLRQSLRTDAAINAAAERALGGILRSGSASVRQLPRYGSVIEVRGGSGFGARWLQETGEFIGFINP